MPTVESEIHHVLGAINLARWGPRKGVLVNAVAVLSEDGRPVELPRRQLGELLGRDADGQRYDYQVMCGLVGDRVLRRWSGRGRQPDIWALQPNLRYWRHVPWSSSPARIMRALGVSGAESRDLWRDLRTRFRALWRDLGPPEASEVFSPRLAIAPQSAEIAPQIAGDQDFCALDRATNRAVDVASVCSTEGTDVPSPSPLGTRKGKGKGKSLRSDAAEAVIRAVAQALNQRVYGAPADRLAALADDHPERVPELIRRAGQLQGLVSVPFAVAELAQAIAAARAPDPGPRCVQCRKAVPVDHCTRFECPDRLGR